MGIISLVLSANLFILQNIGYINIILDMAYWLAPARGIASILSILSVLLALVSVGFASYSIVGPKYSYMPRLKGLMNYLENLKKYYLAQGVADPENEAHTFFWNELEIDLADATEFNRRANRRRSAARVRGYVLAAIAAGLTTLAGVSLVVDKLIYQYHAVWRSGL